MNAALDEIAPAFRAACDRWPDALLDVLRTLPNMLRMANMDSRYENEATDCVAFRLANLKRVDEWIINEGSSDRASSERARHDDNAVWESN